MEEKRKKIRKSATYFMCASFRESNERTNGGSVRLRKKNRKNSCACRAFSNASDEQKHNVLENENASERGREREKERKNYNKKSTRRGFEWGLLGDDGGFSEIYIKTTDSLFRR